MLLGCLHCIFICKKMNKEKEMNTGYYEKAKILSFYL